MIVSRRDFDFFLYEWLGVESLCAQDRFAAHDRGTFDALLDTASAVAEERFAPHAALADANEPFIGDDGRVVMPREVTDALRAYYNAGFIRAGFDESLGGQQYPWTLVQACAAIFAAANVSTAAYPFLSMAAANLLNAFGTNTQKARYLPGLLDGRSFGTMCLSEPAVGSSLGDLTTRATPQDDGSFLLDGTKMWISGGEHELSENIVHMVLARIEGSPPGPKGISLFIVPRRRVTDGGSAGDDNHVRLVGLNHKMGYRGTVNTVLAFGDGGPCRGELLGAPNAGLAAMFHMMNEARIGVGLGATMLGWRGYLESLAYARERPQGRRIGAKSTDTSMVPIVEHADIRRLLLAQKSAVEGGFALALYCARLVDERHSADSDTARRDAADLLDVLTPVAKSWPSEFCLEANKHAIQVLGGYGYTRDFPLERLYRDNRLNPIHEGTHGIQGLDLLGRKVRGPGFALLMGMMRASAARADEYAKAHDDADVAEFGAALGDALDAIRDATETVAQSNDLERALANATIYLDAFGHVVIAWLWLELALTASVRSDGARREDANFYAGKRAACRYFYRYTLPQVAPMARLVASLDDTTVAVAEASL